MQTTRAGLALGLGLVEAAASRAADAPWRLPSRAPANQWQRLVPPDIRSARARGREQPEGAEQAIRETR